MAGSGEGADCGYPGSSFGGEPGIAKGKVPNEATQVAMASVNGEVGVATLGN